MANALLFLSVIWLRLQTWWSFSGVGGVPSLSLPAISIPLDSFSVSPPAIFESSEWLNGFLGFLNVPRPGLISAVSDDQGISLNIHVPLNTGLLAPLCSSPNMISPRLDFQRLPPQSLPTNASRVIQVDDYCAVPFETAPGSGIVKDEHYITDSATPDNDNTNPNNKWSHLPESKWLAWFLSGGHQAATPVPIGASLSSKIEIGSFTLEIPHTLLTTFGILVIATVISWRVYIHIITVLEQEDVDFTRDVWAVETLPSSIDDFVFASLVAESTTTQETTSTHDDPEEPDIIPNESSQDTVQKDSSISFGFRFVVIILRARIANLVSNARQLTDEVKTLENWNAALTHANEEQSAQLNTVRKELDEAREAVKDLESEEQDYQDQMEGILENNVRLGNQVERLGQANGALQATIARLTRENDSLGDDNRRCSCQGQGHTTTTGGRSSTLPMTVPSEATKKTTTSPDLVAAPAPAPVTSSRASSVSSAVSLRATAAYPRAGGSVMYGPPRLNEEGIPTRPMTRREREDRRASAAEAAATAAAVVVVQPSGAEDSVGDGNKHNTAAVGASEEEIVVPKTDEEVQESAGQDDHAAALEETRTLGDSRRANVDGGRVDDNGKEKAKGGNDEATDASRRHRREEDGKNGQKEMKKSKWAS
ncbi:uncharacterized protein PV06_00466 [Exophiala oligosperma]|uniref:Uncharacterized protein n=1 Tax=Exophiala oligosperma TaxID=215243 RepID=A0A0D2EIN6_9EURO|nr:uncharacterized protein PV06_00466 [Exophiala oligosperma]KIW47804.1 hypothetical protein PV06_00466 [Exophiala oligosperma]